MILYAKLRNSWSRETADKNYRDRWTPENRAWGQCAVTAAVVQDFFGGDVFRVHDKDSKNIHYYNHIEGKDLDLTVEQYGENIPVWAGKPTNANGIMSSFTRKSKRYALLKKGLEQSPNS